ncbi:MAG: hypothetical protein H7831_17180, partial [Magnetococcus sp. WYHC-3]
MTTGRGHFRGNMLTGTLVLVLLGGYALFLLDRLDPHPLKRGDAAQNFAMAFHLWQHGVHSADIDAAQAGRRPAPDHYREPVYPFLLALGLALGADAPASREYACLSQGMAPCAQDFRQVHWVNVGVLATTALVLTLAAWRLSRRGGVALGVLGLYVTHDAFHGVADNFRSESLAALWLMLLVWAVWEHWQAAERGRGAWAVAGGVALGLLILTKAVYLYLLYLGLAGVGVALGLVAAESRRQVGVRALLFFLPPWCCTKRW